MSEHANLEASQGEEVQLTQRCAALVRTSERQDDSISELKAENQRLNGVRC